MKRKIYSILLLCALFATVSCYFGTEIYAYSEVQSTRAKIRLCEKVGENQADPPLYIVALMGSDEHSWETSNSHNLLIEEHGVEPWADQ